ncbi:MAG: GNAT family N-acetyltransferase [Legionella sp.]|nr:GNAT family N-acetyltransferase [Legionella sp.]
MITTAIVPYNDLEREELYEILALRSAVFIVEQECFFQDVDSLDKTAHHLLMRENNTLIAYARILPYEDGERMSFGRLATTPLYRGRGLGKQMMTLILDYLQQHHPEQEIVITAQCYLQKFYQHYGFDPQGNPFSLDGQPHILMVKKP